MTSTRKPLHLVKRTRATVAFKPNARALLPYNRNAYITYLKSDEESHTPWYGASFQLTSEAHNISKGINFGLSKFLDHYEPLFKQLVAQFDDGSPWVVTHDKHDFPWWPNTEPTVPGLRAVFAQHRVPRGFKGALLFAKPVLFALAKELLSYPGWLFRKENSFYSNLDVSHSHLPVIIKISDHLNVDFLSTDPALVRTVVQEHRSPVFTVKPYTGTSF